MKRLIVLFVAILAFSSCSKSDEDAVPNYTSNLAGKKFRSKAWVNDTFGQVYNVLDFKSGNKVEYSLRLQNGSVVNDDYTVLSSYTVDSETQITIDHKGFLDDTSEKNKAIVTDNIITITSGNLKGVYEKY